MAEPPREFRDPELTFKAAPSLAAAVAVCLASSCATPSYTLFYDRYAGKCKVEPQPPAATDVAAPDVFIAAVNEQDAKLRECYIDSLRYGETHGKIRLHVALQPDGHVQPVTLISDKTTFAPLACCVVAVVRELRVKQPFAAVSFEYQFWFRTMRTTSSLSMGMPLTHSGANRNGYLAELDESSVVIGGLLMYPLAPDHLHYYTDVDESDAPVEQGKDTGSVQPR